MRTILVGILALAALDAVISSQQSAGNVGDFFVGAAKVWAWVVDPTVPGIPDLSTSQSSSQSSSVYVPPGAVTPPAPKPNRGRADTNNPARSNTPAAPATSSAGTESA